MMLVLDHIGNLVFHYTILIHFHSRVEYPIIVVKYIQLIRGFIKAINMIKG
jgi:hypothetical protein